MGKFCSQCGRPLAEGEVCNCREIEKAPMMQAGAPKQEPIQTIVSENVSAAQEAAALENTTIPEPVSAPKVTAVPEQEIAPEHTAPVEPQAVVPTMSSNPESTEPEAPAEALVQPVTSAQAPFAPQGNGLPNAQAPAAGQPAAPRWNYNGAPQQSTPNQPVGFNQPTGFAQPTGAQAPQQVWGAQGQMGQGNPVPPQGMPPAAKTPSVPPQVGSYFKKFISAGKGMLKQPQTTLGKLVSLKDYSVALGFVVLGMLVFGVFMAIFGIRMNVVMEHNFGVANNLIGSLFGGRSLESMYAFPVFWMFFVGMLVFVLFAAALAGSALLFLRVILKKDFDFKQAVCVASVSSLAMVPFIALSILLQFIHIACVVILFALGLILAFVLVRAALDSYIKENPDKMMYVFAAILGAAFLVSCIIAAIALPAFLPRGLSMILNGSWGNLFG